MTRRAAHFWPTLFILLFLSGLGLLGFLAILSDQSPRIESLLVRHWWIGPLCLTPLTIAILIWSHIAFAATTEHMTGSYRELRALGYSRANVLRKIVLLVLLLAVPIFWRFC